MDISVLQLLETHTVPHIAAVLLFCIPMSWLLVTLLDQMRRSEGVGMVWRGIAVAFLGGLGVWTVHFLAMLGYRPDFRISYDPAVTFWSAVAGMGLVGVPLALSSRFTRAGSRFLFGAVAGMGVAGMHGIGMSALRGCLVSHPTPVQLMLVGLGGLLFGSAIALPSGRIARPYAVLLIVVCVLLVHFLAMTGMQIDPWPGSYELGVERHVFGWVVGGMVFAILAAGCLVAMLAIRFHIERKQAAHLRMALAHMSNGLMAIASDGTVQFVNDRFFQIMGLPPRSMGSHVGWRDFIARNCQVMGWAQVQIDALLDLHEIWFSDRRATQMEMAIGNGRTINVCIEPLPDGGIVLTFDDITAVLAQAAERQGLVAKAEASERVFELLVHGIADYAIYMLNPDGTVANWNVGAERTKGYTANEIVGSHFSRFYSEADRKAGIPDRNLATALREGRFEDEGPRYRKDGSAFLARVNIVPIFRDDASLLGFAKITRDRTESLRNEQHLAHMARHDALTDLPNRVHFLERLDASLEALDAGRLDAEHLAVVNIDLDGFKAVNDTHGHAAGDLLLRTFAQRVGAHLLEGEFVARFGGDEFMAFKLYRDAAERDDFLARLTASMARPVQLPDCELRSAASMGVACYPGDAKGRDELLIEADLAMYRAKASPDTSICFFEPQMDEVAREKRTLTSDVWAAVRSGNQFHLHYQSQHCARTGEIVGYEALLRWNHPERGPVSPADFIPIAESCGAIVPLGEWVLEQACRDAARHALPRIAVNLSPRQLNNADLAGRVADTLARTGLPATRLELEVTESAVIDDRARALDILRAIKAMGITVAMDDFGTGYSSLETLRLFPFDRLKLDRSFTRGLASDQQAQAFVRAIMGLSVSLNTTVIAEGIEQASQVAFLNEVGCHELQGFLFGRPVPIDAVAAAAIRPAPPLAADHLAAGETVCA